MKRSTCSTLRSFSVARNATLDRIYRCIRSAGGTRSLGRWNMRLMSSSALRGFAAVYRLIRAISRERTQGGSQTVVHPPELRRRRVASDVPERLLLPESGSVRRGACAFVLAGMAWCEMKNISRDSPTALRATISYRRDDVALRRKNWIRSCRWSICRKPIRITCEEEVDHAARSS